MCRYTYVKYGPCNHDVQSNFYQCPLAGIPDGQRGYINGVCTAVHNISVIQLRRIDNRFCPNCEASGRAHHDEGYGGGYHG
jgi:hypothetical protein